MIRWVQLNERNAPSKCGRWVKMIERYSIWCQVFNSNGELNNEYITAYSDDLANAIAKAKSCQADVIRWYDELNGDWDWDKAEEIGYRELSV